MNQGNYFGGKRETPRMSATHPGNTYPNKKFIIGPPDPDPGTNTNKKFIIGPPDPDPGTKNSHMSATKPPPPNYKKNTDGMGRNLGLSLAGGPGSLTPVPQPGGPSAGVPNSNTGGVSPDMYAEAEAFIQQILGSKYGGV
jgi:hypothetical protein